LPDVRANFQRDQFLARAIVETPDLRKHVQRGTNGVERFVKARHDRIANRLDQRAMVRRNDLAQHAEMLAHQIERLHVPDTIR
jgi:hypothetical protein